MRKKTIDWNLNNNNVLITAGKHVGEIALKYGLAAFPAGLHLIPCRYLAVYQDDIIKHLFEVDAIPEENLDRENSTELQKVLASEAEIGEKWLDGKEPAILLKVRKIREVGPIINDHVSRSTGKPHPLTCGTPRYTTLERIIAAKLTSDLRCRFETDDDCPKEEVPPPPPPPEEPKSNLWIYLTVAAIGIVVISAAIIFALRTEPPSPPPPPPVVKKEPPKVKNITLPGNSFESGQSQIKPGHVSSLEVLLPLLNEFDKWKIQITGHTDNVGSEEKNLELSEERARSVRDWFIAKGIDSARIAYVGKGSLKPIADNKTAEGRSKNRRVEIKVISN